MTDFDKLLDLLKNGDDFLILTHIRPDGDTLGSAFGLKLALEGSGKRASVFNAEPVTPKYLTLTGGKEQLKAEFEPHIIIAVDVAELTLLGDSDTVKNFEGKIDAAIDHHPTNKHYAGINVVNAKAGATAEIIFEIIEALQLKITPFCATALYTGITTDTGCFRYSNTTAKTFAIASKLTKYGADIKFVSRYYFETKSKKRFELERAAMELIEFYAGGRIAILPITAKLIEDSGAGEDDTDGISSIPRQIEGVDAGITIKEKQGALRVSVRTSDSANAARICSVFGGGGHDRAAGCTLTCPMEEAVKKLVDAATKELSLSEYGG